MTDSADPVEPTTKFSFSSELPDPLCIAFGNHRYDEGYRDGAEARASAEKPAVLGDTLREVVSDLWNLSMWEAESDNAVVSKERLRLVHDLVLGEETPALTRADQPAQTEVLTLARQWANCEPGSLPDGIARNRMRALFGLKP
jgi:hypothetical protein